MAFDLLSGQKTRRDWCCGASSQISTNLKAALAENQKRYVLLGKQFAALLSVRETTGAPPPREVMLAYNAAVKDYMKGAQEIWNELRKRGLQVEQVVYRNGEAVLDPNSKSGYRTLNIDGPLHPPSFSLSGVSGESVVGLVPLAIGLYMLGGLLITSAGGYFTTKALEQIKFIKRGPDHKPDQQVDAYLKTFAALRKEGVPQEKASEMALKTIEKPPVPPSAPFFGGGDFIVPVIGAVGIGAGIWWFMKKKK